MLQTNHIAYYLKHEKIGQKCMSPCNEKRGVPRHSSNGLGNMGQHTAMTLYIYGNLYVFQICVQYGKCTLSTVLKIIFISWKSVPKTRKKNNKKSDFEILIAQKHVMTGWKYLHHPMALLVYMSRLIWPLLCRTGHKTEWSIYLMVYMSRKIFFLKFSQNFMKICSSKKWDKNVLHTKKFKPFLRFEV